MKTTIGKLTHCITFLPSLTLYWIKDSKVNLYLLQLEWLRWHIECYKLNKKS